MKRTEFLLSILVMMFGLAFSAQAALQDMHDGTIYDTDTQLSWLKDAGAGGVKNWADANTWAASLNAGGGFAGLTGWRLPNANPACFFNYNCTNGEMAHLYYTELGNKAYCDISNNCPQSGWGLTNTGPFINLLPVNFWSGTGYAPDPSTAWTYLFNQGRQSTYDKTIFLLHTWAVRPGARTVASATPVGYNPQWLLITLVSLMIAGSLLFRKRIAGQ